MSKADWASLYMATIAAAIMIVGIAKGGTPAWLILLPTAVAVWAIMSPSPKKPHE